ncbi:tetratricopeptide repeat protein [Lewinella sp. 4G2]|uniref:tetratricopeptide repeat protein n=1 Tax=Lewinella sp. 4G2 TaxID=1803372 RepID=UPI0007B4D2EC|nr:tetratricopeptide repeat protein [Lewinella sp. 4G2]OAV42750.1 hypothetical protein A3850_016050 [Lewinella sp. 4G2]
MAKKSKRKAPVSPLSKIESAPIVVSTAAPAWFQRPVVQAAALFLFAFVLYGNTLGHDFTVDDAIVITDNALVQKGTAGIGDIFAYDTFYGFFEDESKANLVTGGRYRPLTLALFAVEQQVSPGPFIGHFFNVVWYGALLALLLYFVTGLLKNRGYAWWLPLLIVGLFAAHPIHTEAVANIKGRDEIAALLFSALATWLVWRAARDKSWLGAAAGAVAMGLGCLSKETAFTYLAVLPAAVLLFPPVKRDGGPAKNGVNWSGLKYVAPAAVAAFGYLAVRSAILPDASGAPILELMNNPFVEWWNGIWREIPLAERVATGCYTLLLYLKLIFLPVNLVHDYYPVSIPLQTWGNIGPWIGLLVHLGLAAFALLKWKTHRPLAFGILLYLSGISVASNIPFSVGTLLSERFLFFPSLGWAFAVGYGLQLLARKYGGKLAWAGVAVVAVFSVLTLLRNPDWKDNYTLFTTDVKKQPNSAKLLNAAGGARVDYYQSLTDAAKPGQKELLTTSITDLNRAIEIHPTYRNAYLLRGNAELLLEDYDAAITTYKKVLELDPSYQPAEDNLILALRAGGRTAGEQRGDIEGAYRYLREAEQLRPMDYETLRLLGVTSGVSGKTEEAVGFFERAAAVRPNDADAQWNYGMALFNAGREAEAQERFAAAQRIRPEIVKERGQ